MDNKSDSPEKQESERDKTGKFKPGFSGNPNGRPKKGQILSDILRQMLEEQPEIKKALVSRLLELAIGRRDKKGNVVKEADLSALREIMDRLEGRPLQPQTNVPEDRIDEFLHIYKPEKDKD